MNWLCILLGHREVIYQHKDYNAVVCGRCYKELRKGPTFGAYIKCPSCQWTGKRSELVVYCNFGKNNTEIEKSLLCPSCGTEQKQIFSTTEEWKRQA